MVAKQEIHIECLQTPSLCYSWGENFLIISPRARPCTCTATLQPRPLPYLPPPPTCLAARPLVRYLGAGGWVLELEVYSGRWQAAHVPIPNGPSLAFLLRHRAIGCFVSSCLLTVFRGQVAGRRGFLWPRATVGWCERFAAGVRATRRVFSLRRALVLSGIDLCSFMVREPLPSVVNMGALRSRADLIFGFLPWEALTVRAVEILSEGSRPLTAHTKRKPTMGGAHAKRKLTMGGASAILPPKAPHLELPTQAPTRKSSTSQAPPPPKL